MKKDIVLIGGLFLVIILLLFFGKGFTSTGAVATKKPATITGSSVAKTLKANGLLVNISVADSADERKKGLSGQNSMPIDQGLLFVFEKSDVYPIWMKDMKFAIDIIWIGDDKKVVDVAQNVAPEPGKKDKDLKVYTPKAAALFVLEVNAGLTALHGISTGDAVEF